MAPLRERTVKSPRTESRSEFIILEPKNPSLINLNDVIHMNGTTDYIEVYARAISEDGSGTVILYGDTSDSALNCYFCGALLSRTS